MKANSIQLNKINYCYLYVSYLNFYIMLYLFMATAPKGGVVMLKEIITLVVAPLFVALVTTLVDHWLDNRDDN